MVLSRNYDTSLFFLFFFLPPLDRGGANRSHWRDRLEFDRRTRDPFGAAVCRAAQIVEAIQSRGRVTNEF